MLKQFKSNSLPLELEVEYVLLPNLSEICDDYLSWYLSFLSVSDASLVDYSTDNSAFLVEMES